MEHSGRAGADRLGLDLRRRRPPVHRPLPARPVQLRDGHEPLAVSGACLCAVDDRSLPAVRPRPGTDRSRRFDGRITRTHRRTPRLVATATRHLDLVTHGQAVAAVSRHAGRASPRTRAWCGERMLWIVAALMIVSAAMLVTGVGVVALWFAVIAVGIAVVVVALTRTRHHSSRA